ncbi:MAG TPA: abortive infection family protein [Planctomycetota bacterium]|nr:abortive infection family protein [Planctomycetota bacterium]
MSDELLAKVESITDILAATATGKGFDEIGYKTLRSDLLAHPRIGASLPPFVRKCRSLGDFWRFIQSKFPTYAERRNFLNDEFDALLTALETESRSPADAIITAGVDKVSSEFIQSAWHKALDRRAVDPEGAITAARTLLESVCKHILDESKAQYDDGADLPKLYALTAEQLKLAPNQHTEQVFKQILGNCQSVVGGLASLRNRLSDAHGRGKAAARPAPRHAELAVNLAGTMATFLLATWDARQA